MRALSLALAALLLAACAGSGTGPTGPRLHLLEAPPPPAGGAVSATVGLREVALPLYARRDRIAAQQDGAIFASDDNRWAEEPPRAATRLLARQLAARIGGSVLVEPWPPGAAPEIVVSVAVDRFIGALAEPGGDAGGATIEGQLTLVRADRRGAPATTSFALSAPATGPGYGGLVGAYGGAVAELAAFAAAALARF